MFSESLSFLQPHRHHSSALAAALMGMQRAQLEAPGCPNLPHAAPLHIVLLPTVLGPLRVWKNPLPVTTSNCRELGRG